VSVMLVVLPQERHLGEIWDGRELESRKFGSCCKLAILKMAFTWPSLKFFFKLPYRFKVSILRPWIAACRIDVLDPGVLPQILSSKAPMKTTNIGDYHPSMSLNPNPNYSVVLDDI
jgi:hypothetical protein